MSFVLTAPGVTGRAINCEIEWPIVWQTLAISPGVVAKVYDAQMPSFSADGAWSPKAIEVIRYSLKELGILPNVPDAKAIYNDKFVPVKF